MVHSTTLTMNTTRGSGWLARLVGEASISTREVVATRESLRMAFVMVTVCISSEVPMVAGKAILITLPIISICTDI